MKANHPVSSMEINDAIYTAYEYLTYLLSYQNASGVIISGYLDTMDTNISNTFLSGVLALNDIETDIGATNFGQLSGYMDVADFLKMDYIYRKQYETEE